MYKNDFHELIDVSIRPQDDFFKYVNQKWLARHPIPESEVRWGTFNILRDNAWKAMRDIYETLQDAAEDRLEEQARDFYHAGMHYNENEATNLATLKRYINQIDAIKTTEDLCGMMGRFNSIELGCPWYVWVDIDHDDSRRHILHIYQAGLTLPNRDYYLEDTDTMTSIRTEYEKYVAKVASEFPELTSEISDAWPDLIQFETALAKASRSSAELRDVEKNFNKMSLSTLKQTYPNIDWESYRKALEWKSDHDLSVDQPDFLLFVNKQLKETPLEIWRLYLKWRMINRSLGKLSEKYSQLQFSFFGEVLSGTKEMMPLWKRVVLAADGAIGEATGKLYAKRHFPESSKQQVLALVEDVRTAYAARIDTLDWMSDNTKQYAKKKLANIKVLIGYPDKWRDFSSLTIDPNAYLQNTLEAQKFQMKYWLNRLEEPTSRDDWFMNPQTVNAYHDPNRLVICFPAGILQAPFFDPMAPLAVNMGGIGTVIGHELTHGFDDQGCQFDADGNVKQWQSDKERSAFTKRAEVIVKQADQFKVLPDLTLKGQLVLGESIADLGGIEIALHALKAKLGDDIAMQEDGFTQLQLFFINYAFTECSSVRKEKLREYTLVDPHPNSEFRVNGILQHVDAFYQAFTVSKQDMLFRDSTERARIW
ncbi:MAG TPA: M13 family metallopeptidase [Candidatus Saccharimonadales bacterium]|nr:M13 family metallopeptidase [Candidatus Saccharimonadales bacterium]